MIRPPLTLFLVLDFNVTNKKHRFKYQYCQDPFTNSERYLGQGEYAHKFRKEAKKPPVAAGKAKASWMKSLHKYINHQALQLEIPQPLWSVSFLTFL
jgi:hypothetical protein